jgi:hypothetical protein
MSNLRTSVNELKSDLLQSSPINQRDNRLPQQTYPLLRANATPPNHNEVILHHSIMGEASQRSDVLFSEIREGRSIVLDATVGSLAHPVNLFVEFGSVVEPMVTCPRHSPPDSSWMP